AIAVAESGGSSIWVGDPDGSRMVKISKTQLSTHPVYSPSGKLGWIGGDPKRRGSQRVYVDGKPVSIGYNTILRSGDPVGRGPDTRVFGQLVDQDGRDLMAEDGSKLVLDGYTCDVTPATSEGELHAMRRRAWREQGIVTLSIDAIADPWLRQAVINEAKRLYGETSVRVQ
ncbi:MAG: hypothetical protein P8Y53_24685, partial [Pseudolabrys sp.]